MGIRLQGTDGIRGPIQKHLPPTEHPVKWYLQTGEIAPEFFQLYTYSTCSLLRNFGLTEISNSVVVGWDSRDSSDISNNAAMLGILQAGLTLAVLEFCLRQQLLFICYLPKQPLQ